MNIQLEKLKKGNLQNDLSQFLKRKRLEMGLKLEDLCLGVCSCSYLSRIENSLVEVNPTYYKALFEKMNIDYENLKKERSRNLYQEILQAYLNHNHQLIEEIVNHALSCNNYAESEIALMVLFYNIITKRFLEAKDSINNLEEIYENFKNSEILFYLYCCALYAYNTNQNLKAYQQILVLTKIQYDDAFFECCIYDLGIKIMYVVGQKCEALRFYYHLEKIARMPIFNLSLCMDKMMLLSIDCEIDEETSLNKYYELATYLNKEGEHEEFYLYNLGVILYKQHRYNDIYELLNNKIVSARIACLLALVGFHIHDYDTLHKLVEKVTKFNFTKYERLYSDFILYCKMLFESNSDYILYNYLRNILMVKSYFYDHFLHEAIEKEFIERGLGSSKYKETLKYCKNKYSTSLHEKLL